MNELAPVVVHHRSLAALTTWAERSSCRLRSPIQVGEKWELSDFSQP